MDDMKKLVEKYKRELMEYSHKISPAPVPEKLSFPEMLPEEQPAQIPTPEQENCPEPMEPEQSQPAVDAGAAAPVKPRIVGYSDDQRALNDLEKYFADIINTAPAPDETAQSDRPEGMQTDDFNSLPPQFAGDTPQTDFTNSGVPIENNIITRDNEPEQPSQFQREGENTTAAPGTIENIGTLPVSGQSPDEQLGRRTFVDRSGPVNSPDDIRPLAHEKTGDFPAFPKEQEYEKLEDFLKVNTCQGTLRFRTYTARNALPVPNARVVIFKVIGGKPHIFYELVTDQSGQTEIVPLPAPSRELSQRPDSGVQPYSLYDADITAVGYEPVYVRNLPIFEGILSVQRAAMIPGADSTGENISEEEPDLTEVPNA